MNYDRILRAITDERWAILPSKLDEICEVARLWASGADISPYAAKEKPEPSKIGNAIAVLPIFGTIARRSNMMTDFSGGTSIQKLTGQFRAAMADPEIGSIVMQIASPGGGVFGIEELSQEIFHARNKKRIVAIADPIAASAAIWLGSSASEFVVTPSGQAGSIGVYAVHQDWSQANEKLGIKPTYISAGKFKTEGNPDSPLTDDARAHIQADIDRYYRMFTGAVARNRSVKRDEVMEGFGQGRMMGAAEAVKAGLADWVGTFDEVISRIADGKPIAQRQRAEADPAQIAAMAAEEERRLFWAKEQYE